jgi:hypothetical protein
MATLVMWPFFLLRVYNKWTRPLCNKYDKTTGNAFGWKRIDFIIFFFSNYLSERSREILAPGVIISRENKEELKSITSSRSLMTNMCGLIYFLAQINSIGRVDCVVYTIYAIYIHQSLKPRRTYKGARWVPAVVLSTLYVAHVSWVKDKLVPACCNSRLVAGVNIAFKKSTASNVYIQLNSPEILWIRQ